MQWDTIIYFTTSAFVYVGVPFCFITGSGWSKMRRIVPSLTLGRGIWLSTLSMWMLMFLHHISIEVPYIQARTTDPLYDGVGGNGAFLLFGWFMALVMAVPHILTRLLMETYCHRRTQAKKITHDE